WSHVLLLCSLQFIFHWSAALPPLHSFPTRRSSDLDLHAEDLELLEGFQIELVGNEKTHELRRGKLPETLSFCTGAKGDTPPRAGDRKSTRLNSSHVKISYAVFCLKKKSRRK